MNRVPARDLELELSLELTLLKAQNSQSSRNIDTECSVIGQCPSYRLESDEALEFPQPMALPAGAQPYGLVRKETELLEMGPRRGILKRPQPIESRCLLSGELRSIAKKRSHSGVENVLFEPSG